ncbi:MAG TPA: hypothetical protein VLC98_02015 [Phnomibacter sp.]|nr:hypothetical protein [Phnomibacter sp.]
MLKLAAKSWVAKLLSALFNFGTIIIVSRYLGPADRGVCALYTVIIAAALVLNDFAGGPTIIYLMKHCRWVSMRRVYRIWSAIGSCCVCLLFVWWGKIGWPEFGWLWPICWLSGAIIFQQYLMMGLNKFSWYNILSTCSSASIMLVLWILLSCGWLSTTAYLVALASVWFVIMIVGWWMLRPFENAEVPAEMGWREVVRLMFSKGGLNQSVHLVGILNNRLVYSILSAVSLGAFSNALALAEAMLLLPGSMGQVFYAKMVTRSETAAGVKAFKSMMKVNIALLLVGWLAVLIIPGSIYAWLFGPGFSEVKPLFVVLSAGIVVYGIYLLTSYWQSAAGKFQNNLLSVSVGLVVNLVGVGILYFTDNMHVSGLTYSLSASFMAIGLASIIQFWRQTSR